MLTLEQIENPQSIIAYWDSKANERPPFLYQSLFPTVYSADDVVNLIFGSEDPFGTLTATTDDVKSIKLANIGFESEPYRFIPFKNYKAMNEKRRNDLRRALANNHDEAEIQAITNTQYRDPASLLTRALNTREVMAIQALTTGKIIVNSGNLIYKRDFHMPAEHQVSVDTEWGNMDSHPLKDIQQYMDQINEENSTDIAYALMNSATFRKLASSGEVINSLSLNKTNTNVALPQPDVKKLISDDLNIQILIYNKGANGSRFIPDDMVLLLPSGPLGRMAWTDTNDDLGLTGDPSVQLTRTADGITTYTDRHRDPVSTEFHVAQKVLPAFDKVRNVMIMNVGQTKADAPENVQATPTNDGAKVTASKK